MTSASPVPTAYGRLDALNSAEISLSAIGAAL